MLPILNYKFYLEYSEIPIDLKLILIRIYIILAGAHFKLKKITVYYIIIPMKFNTIHPMIQSNNGCFNIGLSY